MGAFPHSDLLDFVVVAWVWPICSEVFMRNLIFLWWVWGLECFLGLTAAEYKDAYIY